MKTLNRSTSRAFAAVVIATILIALTGLPVGVFAQQRKTVAKIAPGSSTAITLVPATPTGATQRTSITIQNVGSVNIGWGTVSTITYATGIVLTPNQELRCIGDTDNIYGIAQSSTADLRVVATYSVGGSTNPAPAQCTTTRLSTTGISNTAANTTVPMSDGTNIVPGSVLIYLLTGAVTANSTTTATASGTIAITSNATGLGTIFRSDGSKWQLLANYSDTAVSGAPITIATTSTSDIYAIMPCAGTITGIDFTSIDALTTSDSNYITWTGINLGQSGVGNTAILTGTETTKVTGGTALTAFGRRSLVLTATGGNLVVAKGDVVRIRATATGTLANTVTGSRVLFYITRLS